MDLLEREDPLSTLAGHLAAAAAGRGSVTLLAGEAGIGKTSVAKAFCDQHGSRAQVLWGACDALRTPRPLGPLYDIARAVGGELGSVMASNANRHETFSAFLDALVSPSRPVIAVFEDVHWADEATRDLLLFIARRVADTNAVVLTTYRDDEIGPDHPLRGVLGNLATLPTVRRLSLAALTEDAVTGLAQGHHADPREVHRVSGGNPFFVTEILAAGTDTVPETVSDAVLARVANLAPAARAALHYAAVVPDKVEIALLNTLVGNDTAALDACVRAGLLHPVGRSVRFRHELARLAIERDVPASKLPDLHARVLEFLATQPHADPARLSYHADAAGDPEAVLRHAPLAAAQARRLGAHREAASHYQRALHHTADLPAAERAQLQEAYAEECTAIDREADAIRAYGEAIATWQQLGDVERAATLMARRAYLLWGSGDNQSAREEVQGAVTTLERGRPGVALATAYTYQSHLHMLAREIPEAIELGGRAVALAEQHDDVALLARALNIVGAAQWFITPDEAEPTLSRALAAAHRSGDDTIVGVVLRMLGSGSGEVRRYATADRWLDEGVRWCTEHDLDIHGAYCLAWSARSAFEQGRWSEAAAAATAVIGQPTEHAPTRIVALTTLGRLRLRRGDPQPETPLAEAWESATRTGDLQRLWPAAAGLAEAAWLAGRPERIPGLVGDTFQLALRLRQQWPVGELAYWLWRAGALEQPMDVAAEPFALQIAGQWHRAATAWDAVGCPYEAALARTEGDDPDQLLAALHTFTRLGAVPMRDRTTARLRQLGVRDLPRQPSRATLSNPAGLTDRELDVLALLAAGHTNGNIATHLHISPKTAGHHVSSILGKLQVRTRHDAVRAAAGLGIISTD